MKDFIKRNLKRFLKAALMNFIVPIVIIIVLLGAFVYYITLDDVSYNANDKTNAPAAVNKYTSNVFVDNDGKITSGMTANELWEEMKENKNRALEYIDTPEQLLKLMNAELITQYPDTRSNPDAPIDWNSQKLNDINSGEIQGIIKLKRSDTSGNNYTMKYTDPETFQSYIDKYNASGSEADRKTALSYFTLEVSYIVTGGQAPTIEAGTTINVPEGLGNVHSYMGWQIINSVTSLQYKLREETGMNFDEEGFGKINGRYVIACTSTFGTAGDYIDFYLEDGSVLPCVIGDIKSFRDTKNIWGHHEGKDMIEFLVDKRTWYNGKVGSHANPGTSQCHPEWNQCITKAVNGGSYFDNPNFGEEDITPNGNVADVDENKDKNDKNDTNDKQEEQENDTVNIIKKYYAKVATWEESQTTITSNDPDIEESTQSSYNMTSTSINYQDLVKGYTMPFDYLWTFLVMGENIDLVQEMADLVYNSKMEVTVFDNLTTTTDTMIDKYTAKNKIDTSARVLINYGESSTSSTNTNVSDTWTEEKTNDYEVTQTTVTKTNTLNVALTMADAWMETYTQEYSHEQPTVETSNNSTEKLEDENYGSTPDNVVKDDTYGHAANLLEKTKKEYEEKYEYVVGGIAKVESEVYKATVNREKQSIYKVETTKYVSSPANTVEKTDPNAEENNFIKIMRKAEYVNTKNKILGIISWLFEALETNSNTSNMVDLTKYLFYKATGNDYGVTKYEFNEFDTSFDPIVDSSAGSSVEGSKIVEIAKTKLGCPYERRNERTKFV